MKAVKKDKTILIAVLIVEMLLILGAVPFLFVNRETYRLNATAFYNEGMEYDASSQSVFAKGGESSTISSVLFTLPRGAYRVRFRYRTDADQKNSVKIDAYTENYSPIKTNAVTLYSGLNETDYICYVTMKTDDVYVSVNSSGEGTLEILGVDLIRTNIYTREFIFTVILLSILFDALFILNMKGFFNKERKIIFIILTGCILISSAPLMTDYMILGSDYLYHLLRIEGVKDGILAGYFPVRIYPEWVYGHGYIDAVMYGNFLLYVPAVLRLVGFSVTTAYKAFIVFVNILTVFSSYICFKKIFKNNNAGILGAFLYTLMPYRMEVLYNLAMAGVYCAGIFFPIVLLGFYKIYTDDTKEESYKYNWIITSAGICGVLWNHVLSTEILAFFVFLFCLILIKRTFTLKRFIQLFTAFMVSLASSLWFIIPFLDNFLHQNLQIKNVSARTIQERGIFPVQFLMLFIKSDSNNTMYGAQGLENALDLTVGFALILGLFIFILTAADNDNRKSRYLKIGLLFAAFSMLSGWMCTLFFPWDYLRSLNGLFETLVSSLQYPTRLLLITSIFLVMVSLCAYMMLNQKEKTAGIFMYVMIGLTAVSSLHYTSETLDHQTPCRLYDVAEFGTGFTSGSEYIFNDIKDNYNQLLTYRNGTASGNVIMEEYSKNGLDVVVKCENQSGESGFVDLPMLYYVGYSAKDLDTGETMNCIFGDRCDIRVIIPDGYSGRFEVRYTGKGYWRAADLLSAFTITGTAIYLLLSKKKTGKKQRKK
ncbi:MAG: hypothetical protein K6G75_11115 [Lachnospiraceae bacterium]|nr:hypothetical protein [Lachnospiraceae bacterium]